MSRKVQKEYEMKGSVLWRLAAYLRGYEKTLLVVVLLVLIITALELYKPIIIGDAIDLYINKTAGEELSLQEAEALRQKNLNGMLQAGILYFVVLLVIFFCNMIQTWKLQKMGQSIIYRIREEVF